MDDLTLLIDLHLGTDRQGPGGDEQTEKALDLAAINRTAPLKIADVGCGTGDSTLVLAQLLNAQVTAVDFLQDFLDVLESRTESRGVSDKIKTLCCSMDNLPFQEGELDVIWSEGAIYNIGFEKGVKDWHRYLKPGGLLVASEITWLTASRPAALQEYWEAEYPEIDTASAKMQRLEKHGYSPVGYFVLPESCWLENYYRPLQENFAAFLARNDHSEEAQNVVDLYRQEIELYTQYKADFSYGVYIARKLGESTC